MLYFSRTCATFEAELMPGYIVVPAQSFNVADLASFLAQAGTQEKARAFTSKYIKQQLAYDRALQQLQELLPEVNVARKNQNDHDLDKFTLAMLKLTKYLKEDAELDRQYVLNAMLAASRTKQIIFGASQSTDPDLDTAAYKLYKDLTIELPFNFSEETLD